MSTTEQTVRIDGTLFPVFDGDFKIGELAEIERYFRIPGSELNQYGAILALSIAWVSAKRGGMPNITLDDLSSATIELSDAPDKEVDSTPTVADDDEGVLSESADATSGLPLTLESSGSIPG